MDNNFSVKGKQDTDAGIFNVRWMLTTLLGTWPWFAASIAISLIIANLYLRYSTPVYKIGCEILLGEGSNKSSKNDEMILEGLGLTTKNNDINNIIRVIKSKPVMEKVVQRLRLNLQYFEYGNVKTTKFYKDNPFIVTLPEEVLVNFVGSKSYKVVFDNDKVTISDEKNSYKGKVGKIIKLSIGDAIVERNGQFPIKNNVKYAFTITDISSIAAAYAGGLDVNKPDKTASYVNLAILDELPERAKDILDTLVTVYGEKNIEDRNRIANSTIDFITERLDRVNEELTGWEKKIEFFKKSNKLTGDVAEQSRMLVDNTGENYKKLYEKEVELELINSLERYIKSSENSERIVPASLLVNNSMLSGILEKYNDLLLEKEQLISSKTETHPEVIRVKRQLTVLREDLNNSVLTAKKSLQVVLGELKRQGGNIDAQIREVPKTERIFLDYSRKQHIMEELFLYLLKKREETQVAKSSTVANVTVINSAENFGAIKPNKSRIKSTAMLIGFLIPVVILLMRRMLNTRIITKADISSNSEIPVIGEIGHSDNEMTLAVKNNSHSVVAEQFRALRTNIQFLLPDKTDKVILLTSSMSGEGKSFVAVNLANTFAISGKKVVLLEFDLRKPKISKHLGLNNSVGISTYAVGQNEINQIILPSGVEDNLFVIPSGPIPPNPSELIMLNRIDEMFKYLEENFDYILIDTAPVGLVTDALLLNRFAGATLYIVRQGYTFKQQIQISNELYESKKMKRLSFVINDVVYKRGYSYGYGYGYEAGYGYGYGYGYGNGYGYGKYSSGYFSEDANDQSRIQKVINRLRKIVPFGKK
ncbi:MAG: polysaccharide biosynthesis tyrosine autokinase [Flavipsychrobacter sp.]|nr:polysaccharide biosynthesis tyrosine autokinase [Flavipsychrobacter sp.]